VGREGGERRYFLWNHADSSGVLALRRSNSPVQAQAAEALLLEGSRMRNTASFIEYDPSKESYCGACQSVVPIGQPHLCLNPAVIYEPPTLRDKFAMAALTGRLTDPTTNCDPRAYAEYSYMVADAMLEARKK